MGDPASATRARILDAAETRFAERGFAGTTVRDIAQAAALTPASLYNHFTGKQALYEAVLERAVRPLLDLLQGFESRDPTPEATEGIISAIMDHLRRTPHLPRLIHHETCGGGAALAALARNWVRPLVVHGLADLKRDPRSPWTEEEHPLVISAWIHLLVGHFASAPLLAEVFDEDPLSDENLDRQTRFLRKLARIMMTQA
jgi:AcrR family transcriptional regulator